MWLWLWLWILNTWRSWGVVYIQGHPGYHNDGVCFFVCAFWVCIHIHTYRRWMTFHSALVVVRCARIMGALVVAASSSSSPGTPELGNIRVSSNAASSNAAQRRARAAKATKTIHLVRHGRTEMNEYLRTNHWADADFRDPMMIDTRLTSEGEAQARALRAISAALEPRPELIVSSPLRRALRTAELAFEDVERDVPRVVCALARERVFHGSDIGRVRSVLAEEHPEWCLEDLGDADAPWWYVAPGCEDPHGTAVLEPVEVFEKRMEEFKLWIDARPEKTIAVVAHWGVCFSLTGEEFQNCELRTLTEQDLIVGNGDFKKYDVFLQDNVQGRVGRFLVSIRNRLSWLF